MKARLHLGTPIYVSLPYTATSDGVMYINYGPSALVEEHLRFLLDNSFYISLRTTNTGATQGTSFVIKKGNTVSYLGGGSGSVAAYFEPFE